MLYLITAFHLLAANTIQYIEKFSGNGTDGILDQYHQSISIETYHEYSDLQLIITKEFFSYLGENLLGNNSSGVFDGIVDTMDPY